VATINRWRRDREFPSARQFSPGCVRWRRSDILEWEVSRATCFVSAFDTQDDVVVSHG
jgi:predicted DNA-binding transcriptional regulator AlpA